MVFISLYVMQIVNCSVLCFSESICPFSGFPNGKTFKRKRKNMKRSINLAHNVLYYILYFSSYNISQEFIFLLPTENLLYKTSKNA